MSAAPRSAVAVVAPRYPTLSETFVYREVEGLRALGRPVRTLALRPAADASTPGDVAPADAVLYGPALARRFASELSSHPLRTLVTLARAVGDAIAPGEPLGLRGRLALLAQAAAGISAAPWLRREGIRHLHCHFAHAPTGVGMYAARQLGGSFSFVGHANDLFENRALLAKKLARAAFVACISEWHRDWYAEQAPEARARLSLIRCGVDPERWDVQRAAPPAGEPLRVLCVARLVPKKGIDLLLRALAQTDLDWRLDLAGDGPERSALEALVRELAIADRVTFHGALDNDRVVGRMRDADLFALPCRVDPAGDRDGIPVVLMEAMAAGLPVVAGDLPSLRDLVQPEQTGLLTAPGDLPALRDALVRLAGDATLRGRLADQGRRHVAEEFSLEVNLARLDALFSMGSSVDAAPSPAGAG